MGASGWTHFVPYEPDIAQALDRLRDSVFRGGAFYAPKAAKKSKTIDALLKRCAEAGTHSVLDVHRVIDEPLPVPVLKWYGDVIAKTGAPPPPEQFQKRMLDEAAFAATVAPLADDQLIAAFGTTLPTHAAVELGAFALFSLIPRGCAVYVIVHNTAGSPCEIFFVGKTGD